MKKIIYFMFSTVFITMLCLSLVSCVNNTADTNLWETAVYTEDTEFGDGEKSLFVDVKAEDKVVAFVIKTDCETVGDALLEHNLVSGENGAYGMYVKSVNGIVADYNIDQSYWAFYKEGQYMQTGVDQTEFTDGDKFELVREKLD